MGMTVSSVEVNSQIYFYLRASQIFGLCPLPIHLKGQRSTKSGCGIHYLITGCYLVYGVINSYCVAKEIAVSGVYVEEKFGAAVDYLNLFMLSLSYFVTYIESLIRRNDTLDILDRLSYLHSQKDPSPWKIYKRFHLVLILGWTLMVVCHIFYVRGIIVNFGISVFVSCVCILASFLCYWRLFQVIGLIELLRHGPKISCDDIQGLAISYGIIYDISEKVQRSTSWCVKVILLHIYVKLVICAYWIYWQLYKQESLTDLTLGIVSFFQLFMFISIAGAFETKKNLFLHTSFRLDNDMEDLITAGRINALILQIKHQNIVFNANGVFPLNRRVILTILETIATYMIFYIQFMEQIQIIF